MDKRERKKYPSIKDMTLEQERDTICRMLKNYISKGDETLSAPELISKYYSELVELCSFDKDTVEAFGYVNTWWVFGEVAAKINYEVFMSEIEHVGYKRTKRGEKEMPNELFTLEYAPSNLDFNSIEVDYSESINSLLYLIDITKEKIGKEKKKEKIEQFEKRIIDLSEQKDSLENERDEIRIFVKKYYKDGKLKDEYSERTDNELITEFKSGRLKKYCSNAVALHKNTYITLLDYMRDIKWE